jgi:carbon monoxide dehydrogenase subunit G
MGIEHELQIDREPAEVFAFLTDPEKLAAWQPTMVAVRRQGQGARASSAATTSA